MGWKGASMSIPRGGGGGCCKSVAPSVSPGLGESVHWSCLPLVCHVKFLKRLRPIGQWKHSPQARATRGGGLEEVRGGDLTLNSLLRTCLSLKRPPSFRAFKQLECMDKSRVSFWWTWMFLLLIRNQEESHLKRTMGKSWVSWRYLL